jgi:hypothetical protein
VGNKLDGLPHGVNLFLHLLLAARVGGSGLHSRLLGGLIQLVGSLFNSLQTLIAANMDWFTHFTFITVSCHNYYLCLADDETKTHKG